jgi:hypothetical protein
MEKRLEVSYPSDGYMLSALSLILTMCRVELNEHIAIAVTAAGGHIGFPEGLWPVGDSYADRVLREFMSASMSQ